MSNRQVKECFTAPNPDPETIKAALNPGLLKAAELLIKDTREALALAHSLLDETEK
jgi:hypothetical protein